MDWFYLLAVQGTLKSLLQHHSLKVSILQHSAFFIVQLSNLYMTTGKTVALTRWTFVGKVRSVLFSILSSDHSFSSMEQVSVNFTAAVIILSDLEPQKIKSVTVSIVSLSVLPRSDGTGCHDLSFLNVEL